MENDFAEEIRKRGEDFKFFKDQFGEHPEERATNDEMSEKLTGADHTKLDDQFSQMEKITDAFLEVEVRTD